MTVFNVIRVGNLAKVEKSEKEIEMANTPKHTQLKVCIFCLQSKMAERAGYKQTMSHGKTSHGKT